MTLVRRILQGLTGSTRKQVSSSVPAAWTSTLEESLHSIINPRDALNPDLVSQVIDNRALPPELALGFFHWASQQPSFAHNSRTYQSILKSLSSSQRFSATVENLLKRVKSEKVALDGSTCRRVIKVLVRAKKTRMAFWTFLACQESIVKIGANSCNLLLAALACDDQINDAHKVFDEMLKANIGFTTMGFGLYVWKFCSNGDLAKLMSLLDALKSTESASQVNGSIVALLVIHGLCDGSRAKEAMWVLNDLRIRDFKPDFMAYRVVVEALKSSGESLDDVNTTLRMKRKLGVAPRTNDYKEYIQTLISERRAAEAKSIGEVIVDGNFPIDDVSINTLIKSISPSDPHTALKFFTYHLEKGNNPETETISAISRSLCKHEMHEDMRKVFDLMSSKGLLKSSEMYEVMMRVFCEVGMVREAYSVLQEMKKRGMKPDIAMYNLVMGACCKEEMLRPARKLWDEMFCSGIGVNLETYNILIGKFCEVGEVCEAVRLFDNMKEKGAAPNDLTYGLILEGLCNEGKFEDARLLFEKLVRENAELSRCVFRKFFLCLCWKGEHALASGLLDCLDWDDRSSLQRVLADARASHSMDHNHKTFSCR